MYVCYLRIQIHAEGEDIHLQDRCLVNHDKAIIMKKLMAPIL